MEHKLAKIDAVSGKTFDFVIIGGGTAGLVLAARLTEDPKVSVAVLEAGKPHFDDPLVLTVDGWMRQFMNPEYDWGFPTVPQVNAGNKPFLWSRGKGLGGSSAMNFLLWTKPQREDIDAFEALGSPGWNWERFQEYSKKSEKFYLRVQEGSLKVADHSPIPTGPLPISFARTSSGAEYPFQKSLESNGIKIVTDPMSGETVGTWKSVSVIDPETNTRSYATTGYLLPALDRPNLHVLTEAYVSKIITSKNGGEVVASGVEFEYAGATHRVDAGKEVILSAGAIKSPQILELSGIGDKAILEPLGVPVQVDLPSVGTNVQEHLTHNGLAFLMQDGHNIATSDLLRDAAFQSKLLEANPDLKGPLSVALSGLTFLPLQSFSDRASEIIDQLSAKIEKEADSYPPGLKEQYEYQLKCLKDEKVPEAEIIVFPFSFDPNVADKPFIALLPTLVHPWSRGTIHISSTDPKAIPIIDPRYFDVETDLEILLDDISITEVAPGPNVATDDQIREHIRQNLTTVWHTVGSLSMLPKDKGGAVDPKLKVYGTKNIRVVDLSVIPIEIAVHTQAAVYAIAEQAADVIKADYA
ncbi:Glucose oxidase [Grifola frondosa]|uniref:Glucose oxidase n=1 Tax=Grifola frondosa TaxID=5627 RepID=A0A1C7M9G3_GRIFR|nr:Glucose oxidase [Grifola frondosa]